MLRETTGSHLFFMAHFWVLRARLPRPSCKSRRRSAMITPTIPHNPGLARVGQIKFKLFFQGFWPNLGPGRRPLESDRRDAELAGVFGSVAFLTVSFVPKSIFWYPAEKK